MSRLLEFDVKLFEGARVIGRGVTHTMAPGADNPIPALWTGMLADGTMSLLAGLPGLGTAAGDSVGWMGEYDPAADTFTYIAGVLAKPGTPAPDGFVSRDVPACEMGIGWIAGKHETGDLYANAHDQVAEAMAAAGYEYDYAAGGFEMEYYDHERFGAARAAGAPELVLGYYSPCKPKA